ncbi:S53 family peptidase [Phaeospirillum tilakii]|uniref:Protease pro-enzyme activation domain-containing protein n=1 Tax=Phaeospirillum tilakii TaxID=741673 RepID=A0ABW5CDV0_9PROT
MENRVPLNGSEPPSPPGAVRIGPAPADERIRLNVYVRRPEPVGGALPADRFAFAAVACPPHLRREDFARTHAAPPASLDRVAAFARDNGLAVDKIDAGKCLVTLSGPVAAVNRAFGVELTLFERQGVRFRSHVGAVQIPRELTEVITVVMGLDSHPIARRQASPRPSADAATPQPGSLALYTAPELARIYDFPAGQGEGRCLGLIQGGAGFLQSDLDSYFAALDLPPPRILVVGPNNPGTIDNPTKGYGEVVMDIEVAAAIVPKATTVVYFATDDTQLGFMEVIQEAIHDSVNQPEVLSISWGEPETAWSQAAADQMRRIIADAAQLGVTVCVASGDEGASDGAPDGRLVADFPGSVPEVLCCGGTQLVARNGRIERETVWNSPCWSLATGGGVSARFPIPPYQTRAGIAPEPPPPPGTLPPGFTGRGVPDVAANADPLTGYRLYILGAWHVSGGTSAAAPLWAGLVTRLNQALGQPVGFLNPFLYGLLGTPDQDACRDITEGDNNYYRATPGWDACTGLGSPNGTALLKAMAARLRPAAAIDHDQEQRIPDAR